MAIGYTEILVAFFAFGIVFTGIIEQYFSIKSFYYLLFNCMVVLLCFFYLKVRHVDIVNILRKCEIGSNAKKAINYIIYPLPFLVFVSFGELIKNGSLNRIVASLLGVIGNFSSILFLINVLILVMIEELFFRGLLLNKLLKKMEKPSYAVIISAVVFAIFHYFNAIASFSLVFPLLLGLYLGYIYKKTKCLALVTYTHFVYNFVVIIIK